MLTVPESFLQKQSLGGAKAEFLDGMATATRWHLATEPFDVAIRMGKQPDSALIARQVVSLPRLIANNSA